MDTSYLDITFKKWRKKPLRTLPLVIRIQSCFDDSEGTSESHRASESAFYILLHFLKNIKFHIVLQPWGRAD